MRPGARVLLELRGVLRSSLLQALEVQLAELVAVEPPQVVEATARVALDVVSALDEWPGDEVFDEWLWALEREAERVPAIETAKVVEWERRDFDA